MVNNKMVIFKDYAEVLLCNRHGMECGRVKIDITDIEIIYPHRWVYDLHSGASTSIDGKRISISRYITKVKEAERVFRINGDRFDCRRSNLKIHKIKRDRNN